MKKVLVSVIVVTHNSKRYIKPCIDSVLRAGKRLGKTEIIVFDNASEDGTKNLLQKYGSRIVPIYSEKNFGFAEANNKAFLKARGEFVFLLNPDTLVAPEAFDSLCIPMQDAKVGACQPAVYLLNKPKTLNLTEKVTQYLGFDWIVNYGEKQCPNEHEIFSISGCAVLLRSSVVRKIGLFDPTYFTYYEDSDFSWRLRLAGFTMLFVPQSIVWHDYKYIPQQQDQSLHQKLYYCERNRLMNVLKNYRLFTLILLLPPLLFIEVGMCTIAFFQGWLKEKICGYLSLYHLRFHIVKERKKIAKLSYISDMEIFKHMEDAVGFLYGKSFAVKYIANPILSLYGFFVRIILRFIA